MVFESVVVDVLNRFLGDYVVNLDSSQLKLGIWGEKLELKIPWKNLYNQSVEATLAGVYLLIVPTASIKYDAEKEEKQLQEARQKELQRIEETKLKAEEREKPKEEKQDTFIEKLITQVIKNLQVKISNIHIRYEDDLVRLDNLFAYWNVNSELYSNDCSEEALGNLKNGVAMHNLIPEVFRPISAKAKLRMNPRSDVDFSSPKMDLDVNLQEVAIELNRPQYLSILELLGSVDMMSRNLPYRKFRPEVPVHSNAKLWWKYVTTCIFEVNVKPRHEMWSWKHIRRHRQKVRTYKELYKMKITTKKPSEELLKLLQEPEKTLDIFNITLARQQAEMEASKAGLKIYRPGVKVEEEESGGWLGWMWSWSGEKQEDKETKSGGFDELMTPAEKAKLCKAIGYSETAVDPTLPKDFEAMKLSFQLLSMSFSIKEDYGKPEIIKVSILDLSTMLTQRPGAQAVKLSAKISTFEVTGLPQNLSTPILLTSRSVKVENKNPLLSLQFETNPLDGSADQRLRVEAQPLEIVYDAVTVNSLSEFFMPPQDLQLEELTSATLMKLEEFRDRTSTGLMYVIETQKILDLKINLMASYIIVPQTGFYTSSENLLVLDLGHLKVTSKSRKGLPQLTVGQSCIEDIMSRAYDSFDVELSSLQLLYSKPEQDWKNARKSKQSSLHILEPVDLRVDFSRAMVVSDPRMPKFKIFGQLPLLSVRISDEKVRHVLALIDSIPLPKGPPAPSASNTQSTPQHPKYPVVMTPQLTPRNQSLPNLRSSIVFESESEEEFYDAPSSPVEDLPFFEAQSNSLKRKRNPLKKQESVKNMTNFQLRFEISEVSIQLCRLSENVELTVLHLYIEGLGTELNLRSFDMSSSTFLKEICLKCPEYLDSKDKPVYIITTQDNSETDLLTLDYIKVNFSSLDVHLHIEALLNAMNFLNNLIPPSEKDTSEESAPTVGEEKKEETTVAKKSTPKKSKFEDVIGLHVLADLSCLKIYLRRQKGHISEISIEGLVSQVIMRKNATEILAKLKNIVILDCDEEALYKKAVSIAGKEVFSFKMISHVDATEGNAYTDMNIVDSCVTLTVGCIQVIFVNKFVSSILDFINHFQTAKEALTEATVQAAGMAATGVMELAERSTRMALDIHVKAPVVVVPQSAVSKTVIVADFGLITVKNHFSIVQSKTHIKIPPVIDAMKVELSDLKLYRTTIENNTFQSEIQLLQPVNLGLVIERNLSAAWFNEIPDIKIIGQLKPMNLVLSQEDLTVVLRTLNENIGDSSGAPAAPATVDKSDNVSTKGSQTSEQNGGTTVITAAVVETQNITKLKTTLKLDFRFESLTLELYSPNGTQVQELESRDERLKLAEFKLGLISTAVTMLSDSSMKASVKLANCLLDDKRQRIQKATPRMVEMKPGLEKNWMVDISYRQGRDGTVLDTVVRDLILCASMEFLLTVADVFVKASQLSSAADQKKKLVTTATKEQAHHCTEYTCKQIYREAARYSSKLKKINLCKRLKVETLVLQPCDVFFQSSQTSSTPQKIELVIKCLTLKVSPIIINTVITITSALSPAAETPQELESPVPLNLWDMKQVKDLKLWFLEEDNENKNSTVSPLVPQGESLKMTIESIFLTLEAGVGHRTVPMLLAKSAFSCDVKNWSTLINLQSLLNLEVHYYNEVMGVWEPLLEPLDEETSDNFRPWTLGIKAFAEAASQTSECFQKDQAPFVIKNCLGIPVVVSHSDTFSVIDLDLGKKDYELQDGECLSMDYQRTMSEKDQFVAMTSMSGKRYYIQPTPFDHTSANRIPLTKVGRGLYSVIHKDSGVTRFIVCQIHTVEGSKVITIRSPFQIKNHFSIPFKVYEDEKLIGIASPQEEFCIPLPFYRSVLSLQPVTEDNKVYEKSEVFTYELISDQSGECLQRKCHRSSDQSLIINVVPVKDDLTCNSTEEKMDHPYIAHLWPTVLLRNLLPYPISYSLEENANLTAILKEGHSAQIHTAVLDQSRLELCVLDYLNQNWKGQYHIRCNQPEIDFIQFTSLSEDDRTELDIAIHVTYNIGQTVVAVHSPYWMVNKTGRLLQYKADDVHRKHPLDYEMPLLFSFKPKNFFQNNKVQLMVSDSELSDEFSLDTVGSYGDVKCKARNKDYLVGVKIDASSFSLTRIVTFIPFYMLVNRTNHQIEVSEEDKDKWTVTDSNQFGGIVVDVNLTEHSTIIRFSDYHEGSAPFLIINHTKETLEYHQSYAKEKDELQPSKAMYYTWVDPTGSRLLSWTCGKHTGELSPVQDKFLEINSDDPKLYLASFYEGLQRVALFTEDESVYKLLCESEKAELAEQEIILSLQNMGISLVNNCSNQEVSFIGITSSDVVWEAKPKHKSRWKPMRVNQTDLLESAFREYIDSGPVDNLIVNLEPNFQVCLTPTATDMKMLLPHEAAIRRNFLPAVKVEHNISARQKSYRVQIYRIQIQNQLPGAIFPFVFYPIKPPKSVTMDSEPKPLADVSIVTRSAGHSDISRIKYFKVLIQEMGLKLDLGFLYALSELFTQDNASEASTEQKVQLFEKDIEYLKMELNTVSTTDTSAIGLYEYFHISPIKLHLSLSLSTGGEDGNKERRQTEVIPVQSLNLLLKSIGATLTDAQDVVFKLAFFELTYQFCTTQQLQWEVIRHYSKQAIKQMYVLVLGLDVLGNPFGLIRGLSEGFEAFFYEPYQGAIQGPEEFAEGMALGVKALVGGAVGGLAGAASRITGAMAKGIAAMTLDEEYQQKRREEMNTQPSGLREGITRGGKGLVSRTRKDSNKKWQSTTFIYAEKLRPKVRHSRQGFPKVSAQKEGAAGFFKGVGKGLVGAVTRPTGGIIDMASSTFQGIKRATESSEGVESLRPPRFIHEDGVIRPYREREGVGSQMLQWVLAKLEDARDILPKY
ncbi:Vacuolar protein sorting-associated protein 13A [Acipenser ruthenus]|uniref:Vacuolar protein sorting-associated protein 13A n=1 Tax=Acipenser ruthenus TaxID=7906 RepID=A0A444UDU3_ACIRT|nr:Vacuolar protein sorting-associated protein 13A [Acipenser ruthenus]